MAAANKGFAIAGEKWLIAVLLFYSAFMLADSLVRLNRRLRHDPKTPYAMQP